MTEAYWPFISGQGTPVEDPEWSLMGRYWLQTGVVKGFWNELNVTANGSAMQVTVDTGAASVMGEWYRNDTLKQVPIAAADATNPRIDVIALRVDWSAYTVSVVVLTGTPAANPVASSLTQSDILNSGTRWEIAIAHVNVAAGATVINSTDVTDERTFTGPELYMTTQDSNTRSSFLATQISTQSFTANTGTKIQYANVDYDNKSEYDATTNYRFTAKQAGIYIVTGSLQFGPSTAGNYRYILDAYKNGTTVDGSRLYDTSMTGYQANDAATARGTTTLKLARGDYLEIYFYATASVTSAPGGGQNYFTVTQIA